ncbi:xanthine dehydrogenase small subunit [Psychrobacter sp. I-STPA10]|uniref:xanthine dehydrogenase small subunit n=1 Tax=Psychrobacter sp. I-STPA10 TaxID=2585769 RepID=UPI001E2B15A2|nr:xanthine dehydrogenase small subunit [Psychrobacter sp. I-STPA10]
MITFFLNGQYHQVTDLNPNTTVLDFLRLYQGMTDTKEGCASGDCGACTVMAQALPNFSDNVQVEDVADKEQLERSFFTVNACITLLSLLDGHHLMTASYLADNPFNHPKKAQLHPAQQAMVECHGSQCGFCTPGFVMSLASVYENHAYKNSVIENNQDKNQLTRDEVVTSISGNLCRCTGYRPIIEAGLRMQQIGQDKTNNSSQSLQQRIANSVQSVQMVDVSHQAASVTHKDKDIQPALTQNSQQLFIPQSLDELEQLLQRYPEATLWAGGTDLGLSITQHLIEHQVIIQLSAIDELKQYAIETIDTADGTVDATQQMLVVGAGMTYQQLLPVLQQYIPEFAKLLPRIASPQIRNMGTIGGNIANASPIGDMPPVLLALDAKIHLRHCVAKDGDVSAQAQDEIIPLAEFFVDYKKTKLRTGSYIVAIHIPILTEHQYLFIHKISKRYEDDISACLLAMRIDMDKEGHRIVDARIGLGGMAAIPTLARQCQQALIDKSIHQDSFIQAASLIGEDVTPMTDVRASRHYRLHVVKGLLLKCGLQLQQMMMNSQEVVR